MKLYTSTKVVEVITYEDMARVGAHNVRDALTYKPVLRVKSISPVRRRPSLGWLQRFLCWTGIVKRPESRIFGYEVVYYYKIQRVKEGD